MGFNSGLDIERSYHRSICKCARTIAYDNDRVVSTSQK
ncbi:hypothetical protein QFZ88_000481 [Mesorhizobium sp. YL-MeA3-2017]|jgi:hypothetical protein|nr:hypothetical protein [Mesorhizobium sp. YL-MeA3-2017]